MDKLLDMARHGPVWLKDTRVAQMVVSTLRQGHLDARYRLSAYVLMSNHVHVLLEPLTPVARLTNWIKVCDIKVESKLSSASRCGARTLACRPDSCRDKNPGQAIGAGRRQECRRGTLKRAPRMAASLRAKTRNFHF